MKKENRPSLKSPDIFLLSLFGVGFFPKAPGTMGTVCILPLLYFLGLFAPPYWIFLPFLMIFTLGACLIAESTQKKVGHSDPSWIVLDEALGMFTAWLPMRPNAVWELLILFLLFRFFDIFKPWPIAWIDRIRHGAGIILDDILAGLSAALVFFLGSFLWRLT